MKMPAIGQLSPPTRVTCDATEEVAAVVGGKDRGNRTQSAFIFKAVYI